jgi:hypothetical protein
MLFLIGVMGKTSLGGAGDYWNFNGFASFFSCTFFALVLGRLMNAFTNNVAVGYPLLFVRCSRIRNKRKQVKKAGEYNGYTL